MMEATHRYEMPNGYRVTFTPQPHVHETAFILEVRNDTRVLARVCSCNGVSRDCPEGMSPSCNCTKNPPVLTCVKTEAA